MSLRKIRDFWLVSFVLFLQLATTTRVSAIEATTLELQVEGQATLGDTITVTAVLRDGEGLPISGATIILLSPASFSGAEGEMRLGQTITQAQGQATFTYEPRNEGPVTLIVRFPGDSRYAAAQTSTTLTVQGSAQMYKQTAGVKVPGVGVWILVALLGGVWSVYFIVMVLITLIARESPQVPSTPGDYHG